MTSISNNVAAVIHVAGSFVASFILGYLAYGVAMFGFMGIVISLVIGAIAVYISATLVKKFFSYPDRAQVLNTSTIINVILTVVLSLSSLSGALVLTLISIVAGAVIFYFVSRMAL